VQEVQKAKALCLTGNTHIPPSLLGGSDRKDMTLGIGYGVQKGVEYAARNPDRNLGETETHLRS